MALLNNKLLPGLMMILAFISTAIQAAPVGTVTGLKGEAEVIRDQRPSALSVGSQIGENDVLLTKKGTLLEVGFTDGSHLTLGESTRLAIAEYRAGAEPAGLVKITRGKLRAFVSKVFSKRSESFRVRTPTAIVGVQGTDFVVVVKPKRTRVVVCDGLVSVRSVNENVPGEELLGPGQETVIEADQPPGTVTGTLGLIGPGTAVPTSGGSQDLVSGGSQFSDPGSLTPGTASPGVGPLLPPVPNLP